jgi:hypothetical protein
MEEVCNEAENMKRNCPSVKKILERNTARYVGGKLWCRSRGKRWAPKKAGEV